ncbi:HEAT repeat-containing protein 4 [Lissotriton helveticus]
MEVALRSPKHCQFPSSGVVKLPQGDAPAAIPVTLNTSLHLLRSNLPHRHLVHLQAEYLRSVASDLSFSKDVVVQRGLESLPYQEWDASVLYDVSNILPDIKRKGHALKRSIKTNPPRHQLCLLKGVVPKPQKTPVRPPISLGEPLFKSKVTRSLTSIMAVTPSAIPVADKATPSRIFVPEPMEAASGPTTAKTYETTDKSTVVTLSERSWEEDILKKLTKNTAQWIITHQAGHGVARDRLRLRFGFHSLQNLITEEPMVESDFATFEEQEEANRKRAPTPVKEKEPDIPLPVYYRVPSYCPPKTIDDEPGSQNRTGDVLPLVHFDPPPPLTLQDVMNPLAGKYVFSTENPFEHELYSGSSRIVHQRHGSKKDRIMMESLNEYNKHLQEVFPRAPEHWSFVEPEKAQKPARKALRWTALPCPVDTQAEMNPTPRPTKEKLKEREKVSLPQELQLLKNMLDKWKEAWLLSARWHDATLEQLKRDLTGIHDDSKVLAIATCASATLERPRTDEAIRELGICSYKKDVPISIVPEDLMPLITAALKDHNPRVRMVAAVFHYVIQAESEEARGIMQEALHHGNDADCWAAAQCLASEGNNTFPVINRLLTQLFEVEDMDTEEQVIQLLTQLNDGTNLVNSLLADRLNSSNWKDRIVACRTLARLKAHATQDVKNKLVHLLWNDWSGAVRQAAAHALGHLGLGIAVHNQLREKLEKGDSRSRVEALCLIGWLKLMTAKLLPGFLQCFSDDIVAVRREACNAAGALQIKDEMVHQCLCKLIHSDPIWKTKVFAIRAVGQIGLASAELKNILLWAVHYEEEPEVRVEACRCIVALQLREPDVQAILQDRRILDPEKLVRKEVKRGLMALNITPDRSHKPITKLQNKLHRLCQKDVVIEKLRKLDEIVENGRQMAQKIVLDHYEEGFEDMAALLEAAYSDKSRPSTSMTATSEPELQALMDTASRSATQGTIASPGLCGKGEVHRCGKMLLTPRTCKKSPQALYRLRSEPSGEAAA